MEDDDLVLAALAGDSRAWTKLSRRLEAVIRPCFRPQFEDADVNDLVQDTLAIIHRKLPEFEVRAGQPIHHWARAIARVQAKEENRQRWRRKRLANKLAKASLASSTGFGSRLAAADQHAKNLKLLKRALPKLKTRYRRAIENDLEGGDAGDLARQERIKRGSARTRRRRAYLMLREIMLELGDSTPTPPKS